MSDFDELRWRERSSQSNPDEREPPWLNETNKLPPLDSSEEHEPASTDPAAWRGRARSRTTAKRRARRMVRNSPQELQLWLQRGGWIYFAAVAILAIVALVVVLSFNRSAQRNPFARTPVAEQAVGDAMPAGSAAGTQPTPQPTLTPLPVQPISPTLDTFVVYNTGGAGLILREDHSTNSSEVATLSEGTRVEQIGEDYIGTDYVWRNVRTPDNKKGWVAVDWLREAP